MAFRLYDFVIAHKQSKNDTDKEKCRGYFEAKLEKQGLKLHYFENDGWVYIGILVPNEVCQKYAEILKLRFPIRNDKIEYKNEEQSLFKSFRTNLLRKLNVLLDPSIFPPKGYQLTAEYRKDSELFAHDFFNKSVRVTIAAYLVERTKFGEEPNDRGINQLINNDVYEAAYPLHDGEIEDKGSMRNLLLQEWASVGKFYKYQPIDEVKEYFGPKFALYFAWLGFYTQMLVLPTIVGIICILYAAFTYSSDEIIDDICGSDIIMCPRCDKECDYWKLKEGCLYSKVQHFVDNGATVFFSVFMSFWAAIYFETWKRYCASITNRWGLAQFDVDEEQPRPEYIIKAKKRKINPITNKEESFVEGQKQFIVLSFSIVLFWICLTVAVVFGVVVYRTALVSTLSLFAENLNYSHYIVPFTAAVINLTAINLLDILYEKIARILTEMERLRTQTEFDDSLAVKIYMFQFVNTYSSIFYIAFLKGQFVGYPAKYNRFLGYRQEECSPGGCLMELTMQLGTILIGNQILNEIIEVGLPFLKKLFKSTQIKNDNSANSSEFIEDHKLLPLDSSSLLEEYLEMVIQFGLVTIFVTAFPLAPLFALLNNVIEMRMDAKKFLKYFRRPVPQRVPNLGIWYSILSVIGRIAILSNAFIIAWSSNFIPKLVYSYSVSPEGNENGFINYTLSYFNTSDFEDGSAPENPKHNYSVCRYIAYRYPPGSDQQYKRTEEYWKILAARLAFVIVYQTFVTLLVTIVDKLIPDVSQKVRDKIRREVYVINEYLANK